RPRRAPAVRGQEGGAVVSGANTRCNNCGVKLPGPYGTPGVALSRRDNHTLLCSNCGMLEAFATFTTATGPTLEVGARYRVTYRLDGQRKSRVMTADYIGTDGKAYNFSGRPRFGTVPIPIPCFIMAERVA